MGSHYRSRRVSRSTARGGPYWWEKLRARLGVSVLHPTQVILRGQTSAFEMNRANEDLGYEPLVTREQGMRELAAWYETIRQTAGKALQEGWSDA